MTTRPQLECPNCGSDRVLPIVYGLPSSEFLDMATQRFVTFGGCIVDGSESMWSCDSCHHEWGSRANERDSELSKEVFAYIESVFVPTPPETQRAAMRERWFQEFVETVVPQAIIEGASAIHLEESSLAFVIDGERTLVSRIPFANDVIEVFRNVIEQRGSPTTSMGTVTVNVYAGERRVELNLTQMRSGGGLEIQVLSHDLDPESLAEISPRQRLPVCPYCGKGLRTKNAKQCFDCGMDWHDPCNPFCTQMTNSGSKYIEVADIDGVAVVRFHDLDLVISRWETDMIDNLDRELLSVAEQNPVAVILDFEGKYFIPGAIIKNVFVKLHRRLNAKLKMCNLPAMVMEQFEMDRLATLFHIHTTLKDALDAVKNIDSET